jgi:hypothetical protein
MLMLIPFVVSMPVERFLACRGRVAVARPSSCPACAHPRVTFAGWWTRLTRRGPVDIHRVVCSGCGATHSLWPDVLVAGCGDLADTVGAVLEDAASGAGHRPVAARAGLAPSTVRGWLRRFDRAATRTARYFLALRAAACPGLDVQLPRRPAAAAVAAVTAAAAAISWFDGEPVAAWRLAVVHTDGRLLG